MAQQIKNNTLGFLNKDDEERLVPKGDYVDGLNIRRQLSSGGVPTPIKNVKGTNAITNSLLPSGDNVVIGSTVLEEVNNVYFFVWNSTAQHSIFQYNSITGNVTKVVIDSFLNFQKTKYITGANAVSNLDGDVLLYWTDNINPPRKINVQRAILHNQGDFSSGYAANFSSGTNAEKSIYYDAVKHPPLSPLTFAFGIDPSRATNNIAGKVFQFRYRYIYDDGERSAYSPWSKLAISDKARLNDSIDANSYDGTYNNIEITYETSDANSVDEIEFTFREGNTGDERLFATRSNNALLPVLNFYNDTVSPLVNNSDSIKLYDAVPLLAKSQEVKDNVLFYGNTVDGFDLPNITTGTKVIPKYNNAIDTSATTAIPVVIVSTPSSSRRFDINLNPVSGSLEVGSLVVLNFNFKFGGNIETFSYNYSINQGDDVDTVAQYLVDEIRKRPTPPWANSPLGAPTIVSYNAVTKKISVIYSVVNQGLAASIQDNTSYVTEESLVGVLTHKSGAYHPYGVVYYDRANRSSSVLKIDEPYVEFPTERDGTIKERGAVAMSAFIDHTPPIWATHYQFVYSGNSTVDEYLQYTCSNVYKGKDISSSNNFDRIYLSLNNFKGTEESWKESTGALPDYNFVEGDRLRVISYYDPSQSARVEPNGYLDFKVVGFEVLPNSSADNPLISSGDNLTIRERKSGYFLTLEDPKVEGFDVDTGSNQSSGFWFNSANDVGAYFEVYRPKAQTENLPYYEISEKFDIQNAGTSSRIHDGGIRPQNTSSTYTVSSASADAVATTETVDDLVVGDNINIVDISNNVLLSTVITKIEVSQTETTIYLSDLLETAVSAAGIVLTNTAAVTTIVGGDSWFKPRTFFRGKGPSYSSTSEVIEDYYANDFISSSNSWDKGRPHFYSPEARRIRRKATVWYSEPFFPQDGIYNGFSSFNPENTPYRDYDQSYGGIQVMKQNNEGIILWQEDKTSKILVDRNVIESAEGQGTLTTNRDKLGIQIFYRGDYGIAQQPESLNGSDGVWYFMDLKRGKYLRLSTDGITAISDYKMRNYFYDKSISYLDIYAQTRIKGGYDTKNEESVITFPTITVTSVTTSSGDLLGDLGNAELNDGDSTLDVDVEVEVGNPNFLTFGNEDRTWGEIEETWGEWGGNLYQSNDLSENATVQITADENEEAQITGVTTIPVYVNLNTNQGDFLSYSNLSIDSGVLAIPTDSSAYPTITTETVTAEDSFTLSFYEPANRWSTFYSFIPDFYATLNSLFLSWKNGALYKHNTSNSYANYYGTGYVSSFSPVINDAPFDVKAYYALMIDGTTPLDIVATTNLNGTTMSGDDFELKEGRYYGYLPFATASSGDSAIIGLGDIASKQANNITIDGNISSSGIFVGDTLYDHDGNTATIQAINGNVLTLSSSAGIGAGDYVYVVRPNATDGDRLRGNYIQLDCTITTADQTEQHEIYSVDVEASKSYY